MENARSAAAPSSGMGSNDRNESTSSSAAEQIYAQAMRSMYEQQMVFSGLPQAASSSMFGYNPFMMASLAGMSGYPGIPAAASGLSSLIGGGGGVNASDYQSVLAAMTPGFPMAALYSAALGYNGGGAGMPFTATDYMSALQAYTSLASNGSSTLLGQDTAALSAERNHASPALSHSNRSDSTPTTAVPGDRQPTPHRGTLKHPYPGDSGQTQQRQHQPAATSTTAIYSHSPKKRRLSQSSKRRKERPGTGSSDHNDTTASFFKGLTAEELDVNMHFKNSLGSLYNSGSQNVSQASPSHSSVTATAGDQDTCLDLSIKSSSIDSLLVLNRTHSTTQQASTTGSGGVTRKSVIQEPVSFSTSVSSIIAKSTNVPSVPHSREDVHSINNSKSQSTGEGSSAKHYDALPNLKRLSEQLKTEKVDLITTQPNNSRSNHGVSLLKRGRTSVEGNKTRRKSRVGKANLELSDDALAPTNSQITLEDERNEIKRKLEREIKQHSVHQRVNKKNSTTAATGKVRRRRKSSQQPRTNHNAEITLQQPRTNHNAEIVLPQTSSADGHPPNQVKPKRTYIRTKIAKEKPVDMTKLAIPFEYGWRRETRIRGISKNGRIIGEVFYYTPVDKRMRSYNDVQKYLNNLKEKHEQRVGDMESAKVLVGDGPAQPIGEIVSQNARMNTDHSIAKITASDSPAILVDPAHSSANDGASATVDPAQNSANDNASATLGPAQNPNNTDKLGTIGLNGEVRVEEPDISKAQAVNMGEADRSVGMANGRPAQWDALTKDHFSFNTKVKLGDFMEQKPGEKYVLLNDTERDKRIQSANEKRNKQLEKLSKMKSKKIVMKETARRLEQAQFDKERKQLEMAQVSFQAKLKKQLEKERTKAQHDLIKQQKAIALQMRRKQLQEERDRDKIEKQERNKHLLEERDRKLRETRQEKLQQRQEKAMIRERQRLSLINCKIMETKRRDEDRRRQQTEKIVQKERRQEIKKRQLELARELKQPTEDLKLPHIKALPTLNRIPGMKLSAGVFADVLQFHQFITNFYDCLEFKQSIPTLNTFQRALLCDNKQSKQALDKILCHMLSFALIDPGVQKPNKFVNELGQKLSNCQIDEFNFSEILRVFMLDRDGIPSQLSRELETKPFFSLSSHLKSRAMVWLCDELNTSQAVTEDIDNNMESVLTLRRDKWELEGKIREFKSASTHDVNKQTVKPKDPGDQSDLSDDDEATNDRNLSNLESASKVTPPPPPPAQNVEGKTDPIEDKKMEKLNKQYAKCCKDVVTKSGTVRTFPYGMDRYRRYYWNIPSFKGLLVESSESSIHPPSSAPTDCDLELEDPSTSTEPVKGGEEMSADTSVPKSDAGAKIEPVGIKSSYLEQHEIKCEEKPFTSDYANILPSSNDSSNTLFQTTSSKVNSQRPNGLDYPQSIASWLSSTIDNIFTQQTLTNSTSRNSITSSQSGNSVNSPAAAAEPSASAVSNGAASASTNSLGNVDTWFELGRKLPCDKLQNFSTQLVANSLAFMNCATGSEEQKELEALERLATKAALLKEARPLPADIQKGWWIITDHEQIKSLSTSLHPRAIREKLLNRSLNKGKEKLELLCSDQTMCADIEFECDERDSEIAKSLYHAPVADNTVTWIEKQCRTTELSILDQVEDLEERVYQASIYTKNWADKKKLDTTDLDLVVTPVAEVKEGEKRIIDLVKEKLLLLEAGVERRYLKPPFIKSNALLLAEIVSSKPQNGMVKGSDSESEEDDSKANEEDSSKGLLQWQRAVRGAVNLSELYISLGQLESCIAWEKSVMKVLCQVCRSDDNEDQLLLCDSCDKGYHTYCFKPKMTTIPNGDWYCWECKSKATCVAHCIRCGKSTGKMAQCHKCPQAIHLVCCSPPLNRVPRKHTCGHCLKISNQRSRKQKQKTRHNSSDDGEDVNEDSKDSESTEEAEEDEMEAEEDDSDITICRDIMMEIEQHKDAQPFMEPVDTKAFPQYKKYIKQPMDLGKISNKLENNMYRSTTEFYDDMILIFDNCLLFNEDNSDVGKSGKVLRKQFLKLWKQSVPT